MKWPKPESANGKILAYLITHRTITTTQVRDFKYSMNPGERFTELTEKFGLDLEKSRLYDGNGKAYCRWDFHGFKKLDGDSFSDTILPAISLAGAELDSPQQSSVEPGGGDLPGSSLPSVTRPAIDISTDTSSRGGAGNGGQVEEASPVQTTKDCGRYEEVPETLFQLDDLRPSTHMKEAA